MAVSLFRALGTGYLLRSTFRTSGRCFISENSNNCHSKRKRMFSSRPPSPDDATPHEKNSYGAKDGFITIYRLPLAGKLAFINSSKYNQVRVISTVAPVSTALWYFSILSGETSSLICCTGVFVALKLYLLGSLATNMIGFVYISPDMSTVQISYIDHIGKRQDEFLPVSEIVPLSETRYNMMEKIYSQVYTYSKQGPVKYFKLSLSYGEIIDIKRFNHVFGNVVTKY